MSLLIDGYNLIFGSAVEARGRGGELARLRTGLVEFVASFVDRSKFKSITVVFDSNSAPPGLPAYFEERGIEVHFARDHADADELLEELISRSTAPGRLTVVSSDHRVQRAARRRGATAVDSDLWFKQQFVSAKRTARASDTKPAGPLSAGETAAWVNFFGELDLPEVAAEQRFPASSVTPAATPPHVRSDSPKRNRKRTRRSGEHEKETNLSLGNPFPPGYANDLFRDERK